MGRLPRLSMLSIAVRQANLVLKAPHPSGLSAYKGFWGCKHFSQANAYLGPDNAIDWDLRS